jgi:hypothetical protein
MTKSLEHLAVSGSVKLAVVCAVLFLTAHVQGAEAKHKAVVSIIIDDIGYRYEDGRNIIMLPAALTIAVLPNAPKGNN